MKHFLVGLIFLETVTVGSGHGHRAHRAAGVVLPRTFIVTSLRGGSTPPDGGGGDAPTNTPFPTSPDVTPDIEAPIVSESESVASTPSPATVQVTVKRVKPTTPSTDVTATSSNGPSTSTSTLAKLKSSPKMQNAVERTGPALLLLVALYLLVKYTGETGFIALIPLLQLGMYVESTNVMESHRESNNKTLRPHFALEWALEKWWWFATVLTCTTGRNIGCLVSKVGGSATCELICFGMVAVGLVLSVCGMATHSTAGPDHFRSYLGQVAGYHFALIFLIGQSSFWIKTIQSFGMEWILYPAFLVIVNDTMAYVFGVLLGKHKLLPRLSPKKTVEGFIGAGVSTCAIAIPLLKYMVGKSVEGGKALSVLGGGEGNGRLLVQHALVLGLYTSLISPFGGFLASAVKRAHGAKDFGSLIPGHGGVVDRFDCQVVTAPFVYLYLKWSLEQ